MNTYTDGKLTCELICRSTSILNENQHNNI